MDVCSRSEREGGGGGVSSAAWLESPPESGRFLPMELSSTLLGAAPFHIAASARSNNSVVVGFPAADAEPPNWYKRSSLEEAGASSADQSSRDSASSPEVPQNKYHLRPHVRQSSSSVSTDDIPPPPPDGPQYSARPPPPRGHLFPPNPDHTVLSPNANYNHSILAAITVTSAPAAATMQPTQQLRLPSNGSGLVAPAASSPAVPEWSPANPPPPPPPNSSTESFGRVPPPPEDGTTRLWSAPSGGGGILPSALLSPNQQRGGGGPMAAAAFNDKGHRRRVYASPQPPAQPSLSTLNASLLPHIFSAGLIAQLRFTVERYVKRVTPTDAERDAKRLLFNAFAEFLRRTLQDRIAISVAGSTAYEVDAKGSDLDVVLLTNLGAPLWVLQHIMNYLSATQNYHKKTGRSSWPLRDVKLQLVQSARVPVLSIATPKGLLCDVSVNTLNSVKHTEYFKRVISCKPQLRPLMRLMKYWAKVRRLPTMKEGGLPAIVWMMITVYFANCPLNTLIDSLKPYEEEAWASSHKASLASSSLPLPSVVSLLPACDEAAPLFASLIRFFFLCGHRDSMSRIVSVAQAICRQKTPQEVAQRVCSPNNHKGVWDEVVSIEDPAQVAEATTPSESNWDVNNLAPIRFEPGSTMDLAAKISAATWLTYMLELKRGATVLLALLQFMKESQSRVQDLPNILSSNTFPAPSSSSTCSTSAGSISAASRVSEAAAGNGAAAADQFIALKFRQFIGSLLEESTSDRFILPGCDETLRKSETHLMDELLSRGMSDNHSSSSASDGWNYSSNATNNLQRTCFPFCLCCSVPNTTFAVVLLQGRLHILRILSICTDWSTWWSRDFLSRRDIRSTLHGSLYRVVRPSAYPSDDENFFHSTTVPSGFPQFDTAAAESDTRNIALSKSPYPSLLIPVKKHDTQTPVELFFSPCHFVCRLKGWSIPNTVNNESSVDEGYFYMQADETQYLALLENLLRQAPWYHFGDEGADTTFQPAPDSCIRCNIEGDDLLELKDTADYLSSDGAFQQSNAAKASEEAILSAWSAWQEHVHTSKCSHGDGNWSAASFPLGEHSLDVTRSDSASSVSSGIPPSSSGSGDIVVVPQLRDATGMLVAIVDSLQKQMQQRPPPAQQAPRAVLPRRTRSMPSRIETRPSSPSLIRGKSSKMSEKRNELVRYVPPCKRALRQEHEATPTVQAILPEVEGLPVLHDLRAYSKATVFVQPPSPMAAQSPITPEPEAEIAAVDSRTNRNSTPKGGKSNASGEWKQRRQAAKAPPHVSAPTTPATGRGRSNNGQAPRRQQAQGRQRHRRNSGQEALPAVGSAPQGFAKAPSASRAGLASSSSGAAMDASRRLLMSALKDTFRGQSSSPSSTTNNLDQ
eukprot:Blabericola_migrator_1__1960@NODE_1534_length_4329_cov_124_536368_g1008_i0_p1_GENE_NODE_1534_length_4329_cov_124_536368_g1008_i0NODE_1534_length_4329_cov_124_536368_g1008_i0_p1_ORF_typecomplete_len1372_score180_69PAP_central/PF04928_17/0_00043NTP_transf_2/PF01909_23/0_1_NODE_1534_length_4329_cov_124_536368_g1008_i01014216